MGGVLRVTFVAILLSLLLSCGEGPFSALDDPRETTLSTVDPGAILEPGTVIPLELSYRREQTEPATSISVVVRDSTGTVVQEEEFSGVALASDGPVEFLLDDHPDGVYRLRIEAWRNGTLLLTEERQIFVSPVHPEILSLAVYPSRLARYAQAVAVAELVAADDHRPYMRWSMSGVPVAEGYYHDGYDRTVFSGATEVGVYRIRLEVFPWGPDEGTRPEQGTSTVQYGDLVVREVETERSDGDDYDGVILRYDFEGRLTPVIARVAPEPEDESLHRDLTVTRTEDVILDVVEGRLGYRLSQPGTMVVPMSPFPSDRSDAARMELRLVNLDISEGTVLTVNPEDASLPVVRVSRAPEAGGYLLSAGTDEILVETEVSHGSVSIGIALVFTDHDTLEISFTVDDSERHTLRAEISPSETDTERVSGADDGDDTENDRFYTPLSPGRIVLGGEAAAPVLVTALSISTAVPE